MKKIYTSFFAFAALLSAQAQLTQANHALNAGDNFSTYQVDSANINPGASGTGLSWNFTAATHSSVIKNYIVATASNPQYPSATISAGTSSSNTSYLSSSMSSLLYYGGNISVGPVVGSLTYSSPAIYASYPMSLGTTSSTTTGGTITVTAPFPTGGTFLGTSTVTADGSGTLTIPGNTFTNVIRVVTSQVINFTTSASPGTLMQVTFDYYSIGTKSPVFSIATATANTPLGVNSQTIATRLKIDGPTGITQNSLNDNTVLVYPNPSNNEMNFITGSNSSSVYVYDLTGKLIDTQKFDNGSLTLKVNSYNRGLYIYRITDVKGQLMHTGKITVID